HAGEQECRGQEKHAAELLYQMFHECLYGRLPFAKIGLGVLGQIGCSSIFGLLCRLDCLLALMESAGPRLILLKDSKSLPPYRLGGSRSDLFAITLLSTLRNLYGGHSFLQSG
ncbi:MAG: hypothetical protein ACK4E4_06975, partial [Rhodocyclaceae bacterium]